jgi:type II secretory pathway component PulM
MAAQATPSDKPGFLERLSPREQKLLGLWAVAMVAMALFLGGWFTWSSIAAKQEEAEAFQASLDYVSRHQAEFLAQKGGDKKSVDERVATNELKLQTFLDKEATKHNLKISSFKESSVPVGAKKGKKDDKAGGLIEESITIDIDEADFNDAAKFMDDLSRSQELIVIKRINIERSRRFAETGRFKLTLTVSTFKKESAG